MAGAEAGNPAEGLAEAVESESGCVGGGPTLQFAAGYDAIGTAQFGIASAARVAERIDRFGESLAQGLDASRRNQATQSARDRGEVACIVGDHVAAGRQRLDDGNAKALVITRHDEDVRATQQGVLLAVVDSTAEVDE